MRPVRSLSVIDADTLRAWKCSCLKDLPASSREQLLAGSVRLVAEPGATIMEAFSPPQLCLLLSGRARVQAMSRDGRAATVRYVTDGQLVGLPSALMSSSPVGAYAISRCEMVTVNVAALHRLIATRPEVGQIMIQETCKIVFEVIDELGENLFGSVHERVCRHLLALAVETPAGLIVRADQSSLADAIGSVREVVARALRTLRESGAIRRVPQGLMIIDRQQLVIGAHDRLGARSPRYLA